MTETAAARAGTKVLPEGTPAPDFALFATPNQKLRLSELRGRPVILVFYPADFSPVCGDQMSLYNEILSEFREYKAELVGISVDGVWCHRAFAKDRNLHYSLLSDFEPKGEVSRLYGAYRDEAAEAVGEQVKFWEMHDLLFENQDALELDDIIGFAEALGIDTARVARELAEGTYEKRVRDDFRSGVKSGVNGTPTFFINGARYDGSWANQEAFIEALRATAVKP